jgi:membrane protein YqaA with SNARE-associated domain
MLAITSLFFSAFISATLFPGGSEALLIALIIEYQTTALLVLVATLGNTLGSLLNWWLGTKIEMYRNKSWFPASSKQLDAAQWHFHRYGEWTLLFSWLPIVGDPLTVAAGILKTPLCRFLFYVVIAKFCRYLFLAYITINMA